MRKPGAFVHRDSALRRLVAVCVVAVALIGSMRRAEAQGTTPVAIPSTEFSSGMVGLASGQTARLNIVNVGAPAPSPLPCVLVLAFRDSDDKILKQMFVSVTTGKAALLDLTQSDIADTSRDHGRGTNAARLQIRGIGYNPLLSPGPAIPQPLSCNLVPTLELFDTQTGRTAAIVTDFRTPSSSNPAPGAAQP